jgi:YHS domain-containing protein
MIRSRLSLVALSSFLALGALSLAACGGAPANAAAPSAPAGAAATAKPVVKGPGEAKVGDTATCPVSGEEFVVEATSPKLEHDGKTYFFCCSGCKKKFEAEPGKFAKKT